jgi:hypothetical protein
MQQLGIYEPFSTEATFHIESKEALVVQNLSSHYGREGQYIVCDALLCITHVQNKI